MTFIHSARFLHRTQRAGGAAATSDCVVTKSTPNDIGVTKRNIVPTTEAVLALYQPTSGPLYDLENPFDRTNMALRIRRAIDNREDRITATRSLYEMGLITGAEYIERTDEAAAQLRRHRRALFRLNEIGRN